ncbi:PAS domain-containing protein [Hymenobacter caeli]|uniref:histidine kinase n=1 Tax=Hymenobacter caeli TaxID=2735894 RepID=A0ABX2FY85_9BACT|nr:PAS domain-containing protein [Hymenobacter caeli]NRT21411.1 PAS domain S-box-containing protein [Hymenobacter caeli]
MPAPVPPVDYQALFRKLPENFLLMLPDATIVDNTDGHAAVGLKPRAEVVGRPLFDAYPAVDQNEGDKIAQSHENVRRTLRPDVMPLIRYDLERPAAQGGGFEESYWQATHYPILADDGRLEYILQRTQNVTAQHRAALQAAAAQRALDESNLRTRFILESLPVMVWTNRPDGTPDYFNPRWLEFTGETAAALVASNWADRTHPDDRAALTDGWARALATGQEFQLEYRLRRHDGQYRWLLIKAAPRRGPDGAIGMWVGTAVDIHEQREMVAELLANNELQAALSDQAYQQAEQAGQQRAAFYDLFMRAPAPICILRGPEHRYEFVNARYQSLFPGAALLGQPVAAAGFVRLLDGVLASGQPFLGEEMPVPLPATATAPARTAYFTFTCQPFYEAGERDGIAVFAFDVTDRAKAFQALEKNS